MALPSCKSKVGLVLVLSTKYAWPRLGREKVKTPLACCPPGKWSPMGSESVQPLLCAALKSSRTVADEGTNGPRQRVIARRVGGKEFTFELSCIEGLGCRVLSWAEAE